MLLAEITEKRGLCVCVGGVQVSLSTSDFCDSKSIIRHDGLGISKFI